MTTFELRPVPAELAGALSGRGRVGRPHAGGVPPRLPARGPDAAVSGFGRRRNPYLGTVGEVYEESLRVAGGLAALGLGPGDMVAFQLPNWVEAAITFYACSMLGVTLVPIVHFYGPKELGSSCARAGPRHSIIVSRIGHRDYLADLATVRDGLQTLEHVVVVGDVGEDASGYVRFDDLRGADPVSGPTHVDPDGAALIGYTSGTDRGPQGRRAHAPHPRLRGAPAVGSPVHARPAQPRGCAGRPRHRHAGRAALPALQRAAHLHDRRLGPAHGSRRHGRGAHRCRERLDVLLHEPARLPLASAPSTWS